MLSATAGGRPRRSASERACEARLFVAFSSRTPSSGSPAATGCAAPTRVLGAIAAMSVASRMNAPADVASALDGSTKPTTGTLELVMATVNSWSELTRPPGVSSVRRMNFARSTSARSMARARCRTLRGFTMPSRRISTYEPCSARAPRASTKQSDRSAASAARSLPRDHLFLTPEGDPRHAGRSMSLCSARRDTFAGPPA